MSDRAFKAAGAAQRGDGADTNARAAKARQSAWLLAAVAISVYLGYIAWMAIRAAGG
jgi:hypothetical protein